MTKSPIILRDVATEADRNSVLSLVVATGVFREPEIPVAIEVLDARLQKGPASGYEFLFADVAGSSIGYACYGYNEMTESSWELYWIAVDPRSQGQGVGRMLMDEVHARVAAAGGRRICLDTSSRADYEPTRRFYLGNGYRIVAQLEDYYGPGDAKVIFQRDLG